LNPARPLFARRPRTLRYCCLSWGGAKASPNTLLRNEDESRSHPRALVPIEARRRLLTPPNPICDTQREQVPAPSNPPIQNSPPAPIDLHPRFAQGPLYSITPSAVASSLSGTVRPSIWAVVRLTTSSKLVACTTGRSSAPAPLRIMRSLKEDAGLTQSLYDTLTILER
jgi:hypothetical protein